MRFAISCKSEAASKTPRFLAHRSTNFSYRSEIPTSAVPSDTTLNEPTAAHLLAAAVAASSAGAMSEGGGATTTTTLTTAAAAVRSSAHLSSSSASSAAAASLKAIYRASAGGRDSRRANRARKDEFVLRRHFHALIPAFDPRPGRNNVNQTQDIELPAAEGSTNQGEPSTRRRESHSAAVSSSQTALILQLSVASPTGSPIEISMDDDEETIFAAVQRLFASVEQTGGRDSPSGVTNKLGAAFTGAAGASNRWRKIWEHTYKLIYENADFSSQRPSSAKRNSSASDAINSEALSSRSKGRRWSEAMQSNIRACCATLFQPLHPTKTTQSRQLCDKRSRSSASCIIWLAANTRRLRHSYRQN